MKANRFFLSFALMLAVAVPAAAQQGGCVTVAVGSLEKDRGNFDSVFSARSINDLEFWVLFTPGSARRFADDHVVEFRLHSPSGSLYQATAIPFTSDNSKSGKKRMLPGYPDAIPTAVLETRIFQQGNHLGVKLRVPVAGTNIVTSSLYGEWSAQAFIDGEAVACSPASKFRINE